MTVLQKITPNLWFDEEAEEAARFYVSVFPDSQISRISRYGAGAQKPAGTVLTVDFTLAGQRFTAVNGGPQFRFSPAVSFVVECATQDEVDYFWERLGEGGDEAAQMCGWLADRYGLSWQIVPVQLGEFMSDPDPEKSQRTMQAMLRMKRLDIEALRRAHDGEETP